MEGDHEDEDFSPGKQRKIYVMFNGCRIQKYSQILASLHIILTSNPVVKIQLVICYVCQNYWWENGDE